MVADGVAQMRAEGFADDADRRSRAARDFRFHGQAYELTLPLPDARRSPRTTRRRCSTQFRGLYERTYGEGTAWQGVPASMLNYSVTVTGRQQRPPLSAASAASRGPPDELASATREVYLPGRARAARTCRSTTTPRFTAGTRVEGPAIIDAVDTTIYVPAGDHRASATST